MSFKPYLSQPPASADIQNPGGVRAMLAHWPRGMSRADVFGNPFTPNSAPIMSGSIGGFGMLSSSSGTAFVSKSASLFSDNSRPFTLASVFIPRSSADCMLISAASSLDATPIAWLEVNKAGQLASSASMFVRNGAGSSANFSTTNTFTLGTVCTAVAVSYGPASRKIILNGNLAKATANSTDLTGTLLTDTISIGGDLRAGVTARVGDAVHLLQVIDFRAWGDAEIVAFNANPWGLAFKPRSVFMPLAPAVAANAAIFRSGIMIGQAVNRASTY